MSARSAAAAIAAYQQPLRRALSCVTRHVPVNRGWIYQTPETLSFTLGADTPVRLAGANQLHLRVAQYYQVVREGRRWNTVTTGYLFSIDNAGQQEILAFHWHPQRTSPIEQPHLHIGAGAQAGFAPLEKAHVPTGHVTLQDVLRFAITDLGVEPIFDSEEALAVLSGSGQA